MIAMTLRASKMKHDLQILAQTFIDLIPHRNFVFINQKRRHKKVYGTVELS